MSEVAESAFPKLWRAVGLAIALLAFLFGLWLDYHPATVFAYGLSFGIFLAQCDMNRSDTTQEDVASHDG